MERLVVAVVVLGLWGAPALAAAGARGASEEAIEVVASSEGFRPRTLKLRRGEAVRLLLKTADDEHCFAVDAFRVEKRIVPGKPTTLDLTPDRAGTFPFYCCLEPDAKESGGRLVVTE